MANGRKRSNDYVQTDVDGNEIEVNEVESKFRRFIIRFTCKDNLIRLSKRLKTPLTNRIKEMEYPTLSKKVKVKTQGVSERNLEWKEHWKDLPEYIQEDREAYATITFNVHNDYLDEFCEVIEQKVTDEALSLWYPKKPNDVTKYKRLVGGPNPKYPIYIVSLSRAETCATSQHLVKMEVPHYIVVEPQEIEIYKKHNPSKYVTILELDMNYKKIYETCDDLGDSMSTGPGPARNFAMDHSKKNGFKWHWVMDDNATGGFMILNHNTRLTSATGGVLRLCEDFVDRYKNIGQAGLNYKMFCSNNTCYPPYAKNTRLYSFQLMNNEVPYIWRGRFNEDTILSLDILKAGYATVQFNHVLGDKLNTQKMKGGNTAVFYEKHGTALKSKMLVDVHPDVATETIRFGRPHHYVDYSSFKDIPLILKDGIEIPDKNNDYGMYVIEMSDKDYEEDKWNRSYLESNYKKIPDEKAYNLEKYHDEDEVNKLQKQRDLMKLF